MELFLLRHGETEWSRAGRKQGRADSPLTELGRRQVEACGRALVRELPAVNHCDLVSSPLGRARRSAEILSLVLADRVTSFEVSELLAEHDYGAWEGLTEVEIEERYPGEQARRRQNHWQYVVPGGESYAAVAERVGRWLSGRALGSLAVVVAHDMVSRVLRGLYLRLAIADCLELTHPHTRIFHLVAGELRVIDAYPDVDGPRSPPGG